MFKNSMQTENYFQGQFLSAWQFMGEHAEIIERINFYVRQKGGNKSALARDWGVSPSHLGVVLKGTRQVSSTMLKNAGDNGYNTKWLLTGQGEPYLPTGVEGDGQATDYRDELIASKDEVIALLKEKNALLESQLKKGLGVVTERTNGKVVPWPTSKVYL
jgi:hypothetical protein